MMIFFFFQSRMILAKSRIFRSSQCQQARKWLISNAFFMLNSNLQRSPVYRFSLITYEDFLLFHVRFQQNIIFPLTPVLTRKQMADFKCIFHAEFKSEEITSVSIHINLLWWFSSFSVTYDISQKPDFHSHQC